ncbi:MAG: aspartate carbamoyltransferase catalytic subunit [Actinomycetota bacterium]|nr:aspartate carbamoyltransferase catalytic subunit [Actinomycetota bacterium]
MSLDGISQDELRTILDLAGDQDRLTESLSGKTVCLAFFEPSTRTASSFELAARRSGADVISLSEGGSAICKGESLVDTVVTLSSLGADAVVIRHPAAGAAALAAQHTTAAVINAGDGRGQHPTQALLDLRTLSEAFGGLDELAGRRAVIVGDVLHSRVARSVIPALQAAGVEVALSAPPTLLPPDTSAWDLPILDSVDEALDWGADILYALRLQKERMTGALIPSVAEYAARFAVARRHLRPGVVVMHPGPVNRGVEIAGDIVLDDASLISRQVASGVAVRAAVLALATGVIQEVSV